MPRRASNTAVIPARLTTINSIYQREIGLRIRPLSPAQFLAGSISAIVAAALKETGLAAHRLELEITETPLLGNSEAIMKELRTLKSMGVAIVMDDFGTGYSSLSYLWRFPFDKIKIDRSFMQGFDGSGRDAEASF